MALKLTPGYGLIGGKNAENAQRALEAAERAGFGADAVLTVSEGFIVPEAVLDEYEKPTTKTEAKKKPAAKKTPAKATATAKTEEE